MLRFAPAALALTAIPAWGQAASPPASKQAANVATAATAATAAETPDAPKTTPTENMRASWLSDRRPLHVGDILTVLVDEQTSASEQHTTNATANRFFNPSLNVNTGSLTSDLIGPTKQFATGVNNNSQDEGDAGRSGNFTATLAVKVTGIDALGNAQVSGTKNVLIDGRQQEVKLSGLVRADDVTFDYQVSSTRIANATISYKGKTIKPKQGLIGKIVGLIWP